MKILVAIDTAFVTSSTPVIAAIRDRTWAHGTVCCLFSVLETVLDSPASTTAAPTRRIQLEQMVRVLYETMLGLETTGPDVTYMCQVARGDVVENIVAKAKELNADLIILGASGTISGSRESVNAQVGRRASCPVECIGGISGAPTPSPHPSGTG